MFPSVFLIAATLLTQGVAATFNLYAYGQSDDVAISGYQIYYKNGTAYAATGDGIDDVGSIYFSMVDENTTTATYSFQVGSSNTEIDGTKFAINNTAKAYDGVEFIADAADGFITTGFRLYGQTVVYYNTAKGTLESQFYLLSTDTEDLWELRWNVEGTESSSNTTAVPVALRSV